MLGSEVFLFSAGAASRRGGSEGISLKGCSPPSRGGSGVWGWTELKGPLLDTLGARSWTATARLARRMVYLWLGGLTGGRGGPTEESVSPKSVRGATTLKNPLLE